MSHVLTHYLASAESLCRPDPDATTKSLDENLGKILTAAQSAIREYLRQFFSGRLAGDFRRQFEAGAWLNLPSIDPPGSEDIASRYRRILYGSLIVPAWITNEKDPIILLVYYCLGLFTRLHRLILPQLLRYRLRSR
jgi:hypothetical protein